MVTEYPKVAGRTDPWEGPRTIACVRSALLRAAANAVPSPRVASAAVMSAPPVKGSSWQETGLAAGTSYSYRVRAYNAAGQSAYSNTASATTSP